MKGGTVVVGLTGLASAGKSETSKYMVERYGFQKLVFSDILREEAAKRKLLDSKTYEDQKLALSKLGETLRKESGRWDILAVRLVEKIKLENPQKVIVDGFRSAEEVELFRKSFEGFVLLLVDADESIRFERRKKEDSAATLDGIRTRDRRDMQELGLEKVLKMVDKTIENNGSREDLHTQVDKIIGPISG